MMRFYYDMTIRNFLLHFTGLLFAAQHITYTHY